MNQIGYKQRICTDQNKINEFLLQTRTGVLGMSQDGVPYAVPMNYVWHDGSIYFHGMGSGKKDDILSQMPTVCFTVYKENGTVTDPMPCHADTAYMSVMIFGKVEKLTDFEEAAVALQKFIEKIMPGYYNTPMSAMLIEKYRSSMDGNRVAVYRLTPKDLTAKENAVEPGKMFEMKMTQS